MRDISRRKEIERQLGEKQGEIAAALGISPRTVEVHKARVMENLQVENVAELVRMVVNLPGPA